MKEISQEELQARFPHGFRVEVKRKTMADGTTREYLFRRANRPPREALLTAKKKLLHLVIDVSEERAAELLQLFGA